MPEIIGDSALEPGSRVERIRRLLLANPRDGLLISGLANALRLDDRPAQSLSWARWSVRPQAWRAEEIDSRSLQILANALLDLGEYASAEVAYQRADPLGRSDVVQVCRSRALLGLGKWRQAWYLGEYRLPKQGRQPWNSADPLVLCDEQGFGDTIQALRWLPALLARQSSLVRVRVRLPLLALLREGLRWLGPQLVLQAVSESNKSSDGSLLSIPAQLTLCSWAPAEVLKLSNGSIQSGCVRIALVWEAGRYQQSAAQALEFRRKTLPDGVRDLLIRALRERGVELVFLHQGYDLPSQADFLDQARMLQACDLLITVDTAAAHLGGAMGFPTWLLLPWACATRWQRCGKRTELYSSIRLFRQPRHQDWSGLIQGLLAQLDLWLASEAWLTNRKKSFS